MDINTMITTYNTAVTDAASEILGNKCGRKMPWVTRDVLDLFYERCNVLSRRSKTVQQGSSYRETRENSQCVGSNFSQFSAEGEV